MLKEQGQRTGPRVKLKEPDSFVRPKLPRQNISFLMMTILLCTENKISGKKTSEKFGLEIYNQGWDKRPIFTLVKKKLPGFCGRLYAV